MKPRILLLDTIADEGTALLRRFATLDDGRGHDEAAILDEIGDYDGLVIKSGNHVTRPMFERATRLRVIGRAGSGLDNIDVAAAKDHRVTVIASPEGNACSVAEHVLATTILLAHRLEESRAGARANDFRRATWQGRNLANLDVGVVGAGHIGAAVVSKLAPLAKSVAVFDPYLTERRALEARGAAFVETLPALLSRSDVVSLSLPLTPETRHMLDDQAFAAMRDDTILVNTARGEIVDDDALLRAFDRGKVAAAALDVLAPDPPFNMAPEATRYRHRLVHHAKVYYTPHIAAGTRDALRDVAVALATKMETFFRASML